ncbi:hypothetical protein EOD41_00170 [Mucilaginibacter limnophilus]|uniref:SusE outer membrane protein domain-containing protein n=1 Tax=Mucilaginibacter limnophilus TaxID=1932778 RepID=A0A3S2V9Y5_9SPHI|nr:SusE domain-containing protein [Mucilaginibacter limnophilus]RVU02392.1 hypothetical protein EOD41_00170 [Mucilaginibacter limnophilus]
MKNIIQYCSMAILAVLAITSCKKEVRDLNTNISAVNTLNLPEEAEDIDLKDPGVTALQFSWEPATSEDGGVILYEIAFDKENGDFSQPIYKTVSDGAGVQSRITISRKELLKIAAFSGIEALGSGKVKWTVMASKGTNNLKGSTSRSLTMQRPAGFAEIPAELFVTGTATEDGGDVTKAIRLNKTEEGVFEIYTSIKAGTYWFTDKQAAGGKTYYFEGNELKEGDNPVTVTGDAKTYRLNLDLNVAEFKSLEVQEIGLYMAAYDKEIGTLTYQGNSTWSAASIPVEFFPFSWGRDERYKFKVHTAAGDEWLGSYEKDNVQPAGQPDSYFYLYPRPQSQWDYTYKFDPSADGKNVKAEVFFKPGAAYTHKITVVN